MKDVKDAKTGQKRSKKNSAYNRSKKRGRQDESLEYKTIATKRHSKYQSTKRIKEISENDRRANRTTNASRPTRTNKYQRDQLESPPNETTANVSQRDLVRNSTATKTRPLRESELPDGEHKLNTSWKNRQNRKIRKLAPHSPHLQQTTKPLTNSTINRNE